MNYFSHLHTAKKLISDYRHKEPLHTFLKNYFRQNKKHGSNDRKHISSLCYNYFRLGNAFKNLDLEFRIQLGFFLVQKTTTPFLENLKPEWNVAVSKQVHDKLAIAGFTEEIKIFSFDQELSEGIDAKEYELSFLQQPKLFIRVRPGFYKTVFDKLQALNTSFEVINDTCLAFTNSTQIEDILDVGKEVIIQDKNSQQTATLIEPFIQGSVGKKTLWDCCAGSGGKTIMAYDLNSKLTLTASDKRPSILNNLTARFKKAGIKNYSTFVADLETIASTELLSLVKQQYFDIVMADVPCTGSGTWARTPEDFYFFKRSGIEKYVTIQQQIIRKSITLLKEGATFIYITCSVFKQENEDQVEFIKLEGLTLLQSSLLKGYNEQADTLFIAIFRK